MRLLATILGLVLSGSLSGVAAQTYVVGLGGDFATVQACFDALPAKAAEWRTVRIMPGTYREKVTLDVYKDKVCVVGGGENPGRWWYAAPIDIAYKARDTRNV